MKEESLSFPQVISATQALMIKMANDQLSESQIEQEITSIIKDKNGGRGFFVAYLTSTDNLADTPSKGTIKAFQSSILVVSELLIKNLAMSSAMVIAHNRNNDFDNVRGSQQACLRTCNLIQQLKSKLVKEELLKLHNTIKSGKGNYQTFLQRWNYDAEQRQAIQNAISNVLKHES